MICEPERESPEGIGSMERIDVALAIEDMISFKDILSEDSQNLSTAEVSLPSLRPRKMTLVFQHIKIGTNDVPFTIPTTKINTTLGGRQLPFHTIPQSDSKRTLTRFARRR